MAGLLSTDDGREAGREQLALTSQVSHLAAELRSAEQRHASDVRVAWEARPPRTLPLPLPLPLALALALALTLTLYPPPEPRRSRVRRSGASSRRRS